MIVFKYLLKVVLFAAFIISPFFAPHASAAQTKHHAKPHHKHHAKHASKHHSKHSAKHTAAHHSRHTGRHTAKHHSNSQLASNKIDHAEISHFYDSWKGVRYRLGGTTRKGIDCSALTQRAFKTMHINIPRTTGGQITRGKHVAKSKLKIGDLVFFKTSKHDRHVGIYVGDGKFMHASKKKGVTISRLANQYWAKHYETSKRIAS